MKKIFSASITPLTESGEIDHSSLERLLKFDLERGIEGFLFLGSMGEWAVLDNARKCDLLATAASIIAGRAEIIAGVASSGIAGIIENINAFSKFGCDAFAVQLPGGWAKPKDPVKSMFVIAEASPKPVYLYYIPTANGIILMKEQFEDLFSHPNIAGIKNSSDSLRTRRELCELRKKRDFSLFEGQEWVVDESLAAGCDGAIVGMGSLGAKLFRNIADAVDVGNLILASQLQRKMLMIFDGIYGPDLSTIWSGQKYALKHLGIITSTKTFVPSEDRELSEKEKIRIQQCLFEFHDYLV